MHLKITFLAFEHSSRWITTWYSLSRHLCLWSKSATWWEYGDKDYTDKCTSSDYTLMFAGYCQGQHSSGRHSEHAFQAEDFSNSSLSWHGSLCKSFGLFHLQWRSHSRCSECLYQWNFIESGLLWKQFQVLSYSLLFTEIVPLMDRQRLQLTWAKISATTLLNSLEGVILGHTWPFQGLTMTSSLILAKAPSSVKIRFFWFAFSLWPLFQ